MRRNSIVSFLSCALLVVTLQILALPAQDAELITKVQSALQEKGFDPGPIDGVMGPRTSKALRDFQIKNDIQVTGEINKETLDRLGIKGSFLDRVGSGVRTAGEAVSDGAVAAGKATARGARVAADASVTAAEATASGAATGAKATAKGATVGAKAAASGAQTGAGAATKGAKATAAGATAGGKTVASGATSGARKARGWLPGGKGGDLADRVEASLRKDPGVNVDHLEVRTEGSSVYLIFSEGTQTEWNRAVVVARKVDGAENVFVRLPE